MFDSSEESQQQKPIYKNTIQKKPSKPARLKLGYENDLFFLGNSKALR